MKERCVHRVKGILRAMMLLLLALSVLPLGAVQAAWQPSLAIGLLEGQTTASLAVRQGAAKLSLDEKVLRNLPRGTTLTVAVESGGVLVNGKRFSGKTLALKADKGKGEMIVSVNGRSYRGELRLVRHQGGFTVVNDIPAEAYVKSVLPSEMPPEWPAEAEKAQAIAARTFALANRGRHQADGFDLCATTHCQTYTGIAGERDASTAAVQATYGQVMTYQGRLVDAVFHTDSGGMTENSEDVWGSRIPYLRAASEVQTATKPWHREWTLEAFSAKLAAKGTIGTLKRIKLSPLQIGKRADDRASSGRVKSVTFVGTRGTLRLSGNELRSLFQLDSTLFSLRIDGNRVLATGYGAGHGLGLSQWGAKAYAEKGTKAQAILTHYYQGVEMKQLYKE